MTAFGVVLPFRRKFEADARMKAGCSEMLCICQDALAIADQAVALCATHGV